MIDSTILIVDDEEDIRALLTEIFKNKYRVISCGTLADAQAIVTNNKVDVVLLDLDLPDGSGFDLMRQNEMQFDHKSVLIISAHKGIEQKRQADELGVGHFFEKPVDLSTLTQTVEQLAN